MNNYLSLEKNAKNSFAFSSGLKPELNQLASSLIEKAKEQGINLILTSGYRTSEQQQRLYDQGRLTEGPVITNAKPGKSKHEIGEAFDVAVIDENGRPSWPEDNSLWKRIGDIGKSIGLVWGGEFKTPDRPHFELKSYKRMKNTPDKGLQEIAKLCLDLLKKNPKKKFVKFKLDGKPYKAVLEQHIGGAVPISEWWHPGISLFELK